MTGLMLRPRVEDGLDNAEQMSQVSGFFFEQRSDVRARRVAVPPLRGDFRDLRQRQPETTGPGDESEHAEHIGGIDAVTGRGAPRACDDTARFIQAQRLPADAGALRHVTDEQAVHATRIDLAAWVKVKGASSPSTPPAAPLPTALVRS